MAKDDGRANAFRAWFAVEDICQLANMDRWFLPQMKKKVDLQEHLATDVRQRFGHCWIIAIYGASAGMDIRFFDSARVFVSNTESVGRAIGNRQTASVTSTAKTGAMPIVSP